MGQTHNHQPFETWLLAHEPLSQEQVQVLQAHLRECETCRRLATAWSEAQQFIGKVKPLRPVTGFTLRWQTRLAAQEQENRRREHLRQSWGILIASTGVAAVLLALMIIQALVVFGSPERAFLAGAYEITGLFHSLNTIQGILVTLFRAAFSFVPPIIWLAMAAGLGVLNLLWIVSLQQVIQPWRMKS